MCQNNESCHFLQNLQVFFGKKVVTDGVAILKFLLRRRSRFRPYSGRMVEQPKLKLRSTSTPPQAEMRLKDRFTVNLNIGVSKNKYINIYPKLVPQEKTQYLLQKYRIY